MRLCRQYVPEALVDEASYALHLAIAGQLPPYFADDFGYETYLDRPGGQAGISFFVRPGRSGWAFLCGRKGEAFHHFFVNPAWQRVRHLCLEADELESYTALRGLWFEFDIDADQIIVPDIFISTHRKAASAANIRKMIEATAAVFGRSDLSAELPRLRNCLEQVPEKSVVLNCGLLLARSFAGVRLEVNFPRKLDPLFAYLDKIAWTGSTADLRRRLGWLREIHADYILQIDLSESILPKLSIGLELLDQKISGMDKVRWGELFSTLEKQGLCNPVKGEALLTFPGGTREFMEIEFLLLRQLSHVKIIYQFQEALRTKAYFGFVSKDTW